MQEADQSSEEAKAMGKTIQHKILAITTPHKVFPALCIFYSGFCLNRARFIQPCLGQQGNAKHSEHSPYTPSTDCSIHHR